MNIIDPQIPMVALDLKFAPIILNQFLKHCPQDSMGGWRMCIACVETHTTCQSEPTLALTPELVDWSNGPADIMGWKCNK